MSRTVFLPRELLPWFSPRKGKGPAVWGPAPTAGSWDSDLRGVEEAFTEADGSTGLENKSHLFVQRPKPFIIFPFTLLLSIVVTCFPYLYLKLQLL